MSKELDISKESNISKKLDLTDKRNWTLENAEQIAKALNLVLDQNFRDSLELFIKDVVKPASTTSFLKEIFIAYLRNFHREKTS